MHDMKGLRVEFDQEMAKSTGLEAENEKLRKIILEMNSKLYGDYAKNLQKKMEQNKGP